MTESEIMIKETFRVFAIQNGFADLCIIDYDGFAPISFIPGCFKSKSGKWIVYNADERCTPFNIREFKDAHSAYSELSKKFGFCF